MLPGEAAGPWAIISVASLWHLCPTGSAAPLMEAGEVGAAYSGGEGKGSSSWCHREALAPALFRFLRPLHATLEVMTGLQGALQLPHRDQRAELP